MQNKSLFNFENIAFYAKKSGTHNTQKYISRKRK